MILFFISTLAYLAFCILVIIIGFKISSLVGWAAICYFIWKIFAKQTINNGIDHVVHSRFWHQKS